VTTFTVSDLKGIMLKAKDGTAPSLDGDFMDVSFPDLDFDSLAVLEIVTLVQQNYHLAIPDEAVEELTTPRSVLDYVTVRLRENA
jgi:minimal PKS acyl carrier protein